MIEGLNQAGALHSLRQQIYQQADTDGSGSLDVEEFTSMKEKVAEVTGQTFDQSEAESSFANLDSDGDGFLTDSEMRDNHIAQSGGNLDPAMIPQLMQDHFDTADVDGDGGLSFEEFTALSEGREEQSGIPSPDDLNAAFSRLDADGDGSVTIAEIQAHRDQMRQNQVETSDNENPSLKDRFVTADVDSSGGLNHDEFAVFSEQNATAFNRIDRNGDGQITPQELKLIHQMRNEQLNITV